MVDAGYLNSSGGIRGGAAEIFFLHRDKLILEKANDNPQYRSLPRGDIIRNKIEHSTFHRNWIDGIYTSCLKILNHTPAISAEYGGEFVPGANPPMKGPIHDPYFVQKKLELSGNAAQAKKPALALADLSKYFMLANSVTAAAALTIDLQLPTTPPPVAATAQAALLTALALIMTPEKYEKRKSADFIPSVPSDEFPNLEYGTSEYSIKRRQELVFEAVAESFDALVKSAQSKPNVFLLPISNGLFLPISEEAKKILEQKFPKVANDNAITNLINYEALKRALVKPLCLATIGVLFGSDPEGFVNKMGDIGPDAVKALNELNSDPKPESLKLEETAERSTAIVDTPDADRNNVPRHRWPFIPKKYQNVGTGLKNEIYVRLKEIGSRFISSGASNNNADDNHKGLTVMFVLFHESKMDPGAAAQIKKPGAPYSATFRPDEYNTTSDALIWQASKNSVAKATSSLTVALFELAPIIQPLSDTKFLRGMDLMLQLEYYEERLTREMAIMGSISQGKDKVAKSGGRGGLDGRLYGGPDPHVETNLASVLRKYLNVRNDERQDPPLSKFLPSKLGGTDDTYKGYTSPRYIVQTPYDLYGFHIGSWGDGSKLINTPVDADALAKRVTLYTMALTSYQMCADGEHIQRYMTATGMSSIDWDKTGIIGLKKYVDDKGNILLPKKGPLLYQNPVNWINDNRVEMNSMQKKYRDDVNRR